MSAGSRRRESGRRRRADRGRCSRRGGEWCGRRLRCASCGARPGEAAARDLLRSAAGQPQAERKPNDDCDSGDDDDRHMQSSLSLTGVRCSGANVYLAPCDHASVYLAVDATAQVDVLTCVHRLRAWCGDCQGLSHAAAMRPNLGAPSSDGGRGAIAPHPSG